MLIGVLHIKKLLRKKLTAESCQLAFIYAAA